MKIIDFSYMSTKDKSDKKRTERSRVYEYQFVLDFVKEQFSKQRNLSIHNTWCWWWKVHLDFAKELEKHATIVINSDIDTIRWEWKPDHYAIYNILEKPNFPADIVLCISTLEHLENRKLAIENLLEWVNVWWYLVVTLDSPPVPLWLLEEYLWVNCKDVKERLDPENSICPHDEREWINIVKLIIQK